VLVEEATIPATHVTIAYHPALTHTDRSEILQTVHESTLIDPVWERPMFFGYDLVIAFCRCKILRSLLRDVREGLKRVHKVNSNLELVRERLVIEKDPWILIFAVPTVFQLTHTLHESRKL
jgi:hypothetical protein